MDGVLAFRFTSRDSLGHDTYVTASWTRDTIAPVIASGSLRIAEGAPIVTSNYVPTRLDAGDEATKITHFCMAYAVGDEPTPSPTPECWISVDNPEQPALTPSPTLAPGGFFFTMGLRDFYYRLGYLRGDYHLTTWARDAAGNVSAPVTANTFFEPPVPPVVVNVLVSRTDPPALPFIPADLSADSGNPIYIRWKIVSPQPDKLKPAPVSLYVTNDDVTFTLIASGLQDTAHGGCAVPVNLSSGCYVWNGVVPETGVSVNAATYFRIRVAVEDLNGLVTASSTNPMNGAGLSLIAGNTDAGVGSSARAAIFRSPNFGLIPPDSGSLAVSSLGHIFFRDRLKGLIMVKPSDGIVRVLMPISAAANANVFEGPLTSPSATVRNVLRIALDWSNGLVFWDYDRIRRIDLRTMTVSTLVGGCTSDCSIADGVDARKVVFTPQGLSSVSVLAQLVPLPNGNLLFESDAQRTNQTRLRIYQRHNGQVTSITVKGNGHSPLQSGHETDSDTEDLSQCSSTSYGVDTLCQRTGFSMEFNPITSALLTLHLSINHVLTGNTLQAFANLIPSGSLAGTSQAPHPPYVDGSYYAFSRAVGRNGRLYAINRTHGKISVFDKEPATEGGQWIPIIGSTRAGACPDGTPAMSCEIQPSDLFVDPQNRLFFVDRGAIRTLDNGKVVTVYGQSTYFGDGGLAQSARFNEVPSLERANNGEVVVIDTEESRIRAFMPGGTIQTLAGTGTVATVANYDIAAPPANQQPFSVATVGQSAVFSMDRSSGDIFTTSARMIVRLRRSTGRWEPILNVNAGYTPNVLGFDGQDILVHTNMYTPALRHYDGFLRHVNIGGSISDPAPANRYAGLPDTSVDPSTFCADGTLLTNCLIPQSIGMAVGRATWDAPRNRWIMAASSGSTRVVTMSREVNATIGTLKNIGLPVHPKSIAYVNDANGERVYFCSTAGRLYVSNLTTGIESALPWRVPSMHCRGLSIVHNPVNNSLIFPVEQSGLYGVAEFVLP